VNWNDAIDRLHNAAGPDEYMVAVQELWILRMQEEKGRHGSS